MNWGLALSPDLAVGGLREALRAAVDSGYQEVWAGEAVGADAFALLSAAAVLEPSLHVGTAIVPAFTRAPGLLAVSAATLANLAPGRCLIGVGASSPAVVERWNGIPYEQPYQRTRDILRFVRPALAGERISCHYDTFSIDGFRLSHPPEVAPELLVAALRPGMLRLAASAADGAVLTWVSPSDVARMAAYLRPEQKKVVWVSVCPSTDAERVRDTMRPLVAEYLTVPGYAAAQEWLERADVLRPVWDAWKARRRRDAVAAVPDELIDEFVIHGSPADCRERLAEYEVAGATSLVLSFVPLDSDLATVLSALTR